MTGSVPLRRVGRGCGRAVYGISVEGVIESTVQEACRSERVASYRRVRLSTSGRLRGAGFALLATFDRPHFTLVIAYISELTLARLDRCFDDPIPNPGRPSQGYADARSIAVTEIHDIAVDFMDMTDDRLLWARTADVREGFEPAVGRYAIVGDDDADPRVARIVDVSADGFLRLQVLPGPLEAHRSLLVRA